MGINEVVAASDSILISDNAKMYISIRIHSQFYRPFH